MKVNFYISRISRNCNLIYRVIRHEDKNRDVISEHETLKEAIRQLLKAEVNEEKKKNGTT